MAYRDYPYHVPRLQRRWQDMTPFLVVEEHNPAFEVGFLVLGIEDLEPACPGGEDVQPAVIVSTRNFENAGAASHFLHLRFPRQDDPKLLPFGTLGLRFQTLADHPLVPVLEDVQRQRRLRQQHNFERKEGKQDLGHGKTPPARL